MVIVKDIITDMMGRMVIVEDIMTDMTGRMVIVKDIMTDMTAYASEQLHMSGVKAVSVHAGMLNAARNIQQRLTGQNSPVHMHA